MPKFKVGDKVRRISGPWVGTRMQVGSEWIITEVNSFTDCIRVEGFDEWVCGRYFQLITPTPFPLYSEEQAVKLLTERGYEVKTPLEPLKGKMMIVKTRYGDIYGYSVGTNLSDTAEVIAIVDWTEGQGVE